MSAIGPNGHGQTVASSQLAVRRSKMVSLQSDYGKYLKGQQDDSVDAGALYRSITSNVGLRELWALLDSPRATSGLTARNVWQAAAKGN